jgi:arylsulfatase A
MTLGRRDFVKSLVASVAAPTMANALPEGEQQHALVKVHAPRKQKKPNVVLMICDDLGYGDPHCYGSNLSTPNLDSIAEQGQRFTHYNSAHPICSASRAALLTGRYGLRMDTTGAFGPQSKTGTSLDEMLISNLFKQGGYKTHAVGKWHLGNSGAYLPTQRGFDSFFGVPYSVDMNPLPLMRDETVLEENTDRTTLTPRYTEDAVRYIEESNDEPFFLYIMTFGEIII